MAEESGIVSRWARYRPSKAACFWSCVLCIGATVSLGFTWGGWVTAGTAANQAQQATDTALAHLAATVCVTQFKDSPNAAIQLASLKKMYPWEASAFIAKHSWVKLPGIDEPIPGAADLCAKQLTTVKLPDANAMQSSPSSGS